MMQRVYYVMQGVYGMMQDVYYVMQGVYGMMQDVYCVMQGVYDMMRDVSVCLIPVRFAFDRASPRIEQAPNSWEY